MTQQDRSANEEATPAGVVGGHRRETERRRRYRFTRILSMAGLLLLITALVIPATGYFVVFVQPHRETALVVNDTRYTWGEYLTRLKMIIAEAQAIGTYPISIIPDQDCCQLFTPRHPATRAARRDVEAAERGLPVEEMVAGAVAAVEREDFSFPPRADAPPARAHQAASGAAGPPPEDAAR